MGMSGASFTVVHGHFSSFKHEGPYHHQSFLSNSLGVQPRETTAVSDKRSSA